MTPEQRAEALVKEWIMPMGDPWAVRAIADIARAIREAVEEAVEEVTPEHRGYPINEIHAANTSGQSVQLESKS
jgi:hypothetical protein